MPPLHIKLPRELAAVRGAAAQFRAFLEAERIPEEHRFGCELAFVEACNNAVQHAPGREPICVNAIVRDGALEIRIEDHGPGFVFPERAELPLPTQEGGRGLFLIQSFMDEAYGEGAAGSYCLVMRKAV